MTSKKTYYNLFDFTQESNEIIVNQNSIQTHTQSQSQSQRQSQSQNSRNDIINISLNKFKEQICSLFLNANSIMNSNIDIDKTSELICQSAKQIILKHVLKTNTISDSQENNTVVQKYSRVSNQDIVRLTKHLDNLLLDEKFKSYFDSNKKCLGLGNGLKQCKKKSNYISNYMLCETHKHKYYELLDEIIEYISNVRNDFLETQEH